METSAENFVSRTILAEVKRVNGKFDILYQLANVSISYPDGIIKEKIYPPVAEDFFSSLKSKLDHNLKQLNDTILGNEKVKIINKDGGRIKLSPSDAQTEPTNLKKLHQKIQNR